MFACVGICGQCHELMAISDLIITKPGGMTSAEALCRGLPMIIYRPIPGQEEANTAFLTNKVAVRLILELSWITYYMSY